MTLQYQVQKRSGKSTKEEMEEKIDNLRKRGQSIGNYRLRERID